MVKLVLGTAQFGLDYGITNSKGRVKKCEIKKILSTSENNEIRYLDTASLYGESERILGDLAPRNFNIITKIPPLDITNTNHIYESFKLSLNKLKRKKLNGVMLHKEDDLFIDGTIHELQALKDDGLVDNIGCSFYSPVALKKALKSNFKLDIIQIPASCLDNRFEKSGLLEVAKYNDIKVHARSLFLQGLLLNKEINLPSSIKKYSSHLLRYFQFCKENSLSPLEMALVYLIRNKFIDYGVFGCDSNRQMQDIITSYRRADAIEKDIDFDSVVSDSKMLLNPSLWK
jgi:aryl-alcohol dehydrogenase-like predicted oxidoreductase